MGLNFSGFFAWVMWRSIYLSKLPRFEKKVRVAVDWTLDLVFSKDIVQFQTFRSEALTHEETKVIAQEEAKQKKPKPGEANPEASNLNSALPVAQAVVADVSAPTKAGSATS